MPEITEEQNMEQNMEQIQIETINRNKAYINQLKQILSFIDKLSGKPNKDRLAYANLLTQLIGIMIGSIKGWQSWFNFNSMDTLFTLKELEEIVPKIEKCVRDFIEIDLEITEIKTKDVEKEHEETVKKTKKSKTKQYVS